MSVVLRGILIIVCILVGLGIIAYQSFRNECIGKRCFTILLYMASIYPMIEIGIERADMVFSPAKVIVGVFWLFNLRLWKYFMNKKYILITIFIVIGIFSALCSEFIVKSILSIYNYLIIFMIFFMAIKAIEYSGIMRFSDKIITRIAFWIIVFAIIQIFFDRTFTMYFSSRLAENRLEYCFFDPQTSGTAVALLSIFYLNRYLCRYGKYNLLLFVGFVILAGFTGSKSSLLGIGAAIIVSLLYAKIRPTILFTSIALVGITIATSGYWMQLPVIERFYDMDNSLDTRQSFYWAAAISVFLRNWFIGIGPGNFQDYNIEHHLHLVHHSSSGTIIYASQPESGYLLMLDEFGIFVIIPLILVISLIGLKNKSPYNFALITPWMISFISLANLSYTSIAFLLSIFAAMIYYENHKIKNQIV